MTGQDAVSAALAQAQRDSRSAMADDPKAATGSCTISSAGWSECKPNITKEACAKQEGPGVTVTWVEGGSC